MLKQCECCLEHGFIYSTFPKKVDKIHKTLCQHRVPVLHVTSVSSNFHSVDMFLHVIKIVKTAKAKFGEECKLFSGVYLKLHIVGACILNVLDK